MILSYDLFTQLIELFKKINQIRWFFLCMSMDFRREVLTKRPTRFLTISLLLI